MKSTKKRQNVNVDGNLGSNSSIGPVTFSVSNKEDQLVFDVFSRHYLNANGQNSASMPKSDRITDVIAACHDCDLRNDRRFKVMPVICKCEVSSPGVTSEAKGVDGVEVMDEIVSTTGSIDLAKDVVEEAYSGYHDMNGSYVRLKTGSRFNLDETDMVKGKDRFPFRLIGSLMCGRTIIKLVKMARAGILNSTIHLTSSSKKLINYREDYIIGFIYYMYKDRKYYFNGFEAEILITKNGMKVSGRNPSPGLEEVKNTSVEMRKEVTTPSNSEFDRNNLSPEVKALLQTDDTWYSQNEYDREDEYGYH